jgi:hypothetical protein
LNPNQILILGMLSASLSAEPAAAPGLTVVDFPGSLQVERDVPDAYDEAEKDDARWAVPKALKFTAPTRAVLVDPPGKAFRIHASLSNPTSKPVRAVLWQVGSLNALYLHPIEDADIKRKPRDPGRPPLPMQRPLPPIRITVPPKTAIRFTALADLSDYDFKSGSPAKLEWSFHFWKAPEERGILPVTLP